MGARRSIFTGGVAIVLALALGSCSSDDSGDSEGTESTTTTEAAAGDAQAATDAVASPTPPPNVPLLGVLDAQGGTFADGTLTLTGVDANGIWFTDRPVRQAGSLGLEPFTELFFSRGAAPNAALELADTEQPGDVAIVELSDPEVDAEAGTVSFTATVIPDAGGQRTVDHPGLAGYSSQNTGTVPDSFGASALFIDPGFTPVEENSTAGDDVSALSTELSTTLDGFESFVMQVRVAYDQDPAQCQQQYLEEAAEVISDLTGQAVPAVQQMQQDQAANGGVLPADDAELFSSTQQQVDDAQVSLTQFQDQLPDILAGGTCGQ